jgi:hypothetical protein
MYKSSLLLDESENEMTSLLHPEVLMMAEDKANKASTDRNELL